MKIYHDEMKSVSTLSSITCDVCQTNYTTDEITEIQEFLHIDFTAGYGSIFGDMNKIKADVCQSCLSATLGRFLRITDSVRMSEEELKAELSKPLPMIKTDPYEEGRYYAEGDYNDMIPYDPKMTPNLYADSADEERFIEGYYEYWKEKNFSLD